MTLIEHFPNRRPAETQNRPSACELPDGMRLIETPEDSVCALDRHMLLHADMPLATAGLRLTPQTLLSLIASLEPLEQLRLEIRFSPGNVSGAIRFGFTATGADAASTLRRGEDLAFALERALDIALPNFAVAPEPDAPRCDLPHEQRISPAGRRLALAAAAAGAPLPQLVAGCDARLQPSEEIVLPPRTTTLGSHLFGLKLLADLACEVGIDIVFRRQIFDAGWRRRLVQARARLADRALAEFAERSRLSGADLQASDHLDALIAEEAACELTVTLRSELPLGDVIASIVSQSLLGAPLDNRPGEVELDLRSFYPAEPFQRELLPHVLAMVPATAALRKASCLIPQQGVSLGTCADGTALRLGEGDRTQHTYVIGATGTGKTTLIANMIREDMEAGKGVVLIDPHGDLWRELLPLVPSHRRDELVAIHLGDPVNYPFTMNILAGQGGDPARERHTITNALIDIFKKVLYQGVPEAFGPMFEIYFRNALLLLMEADGDEATILDFERIFSSRRLQVAKADKSSSASDDDEEDEPFNPFSRGSGRGKTFRQSLLERCTNERILDFWTMATDVGGEASLENIAPYIVCKLTQITGSPLLAPVLGARDSSLDFRDVIRNGKICLINLAKGDVGAKDVAFAGGLMTVRLVMAALAQASVPAAERRFVGVYLDEFPTYSTDMLADAMAEVRKYGIALTLANQSLSQVDGRGDKADAINGILANAANLLALRVGIPDAAVIARWFSPHYTAEELAQLPNFTAIARVLADGKPLPPLRIGTPAPLVPEEAGSRPSA